MFLLDQIHLLQFTWVQFIRLEYVRFRQVHLQTWRSRNRKDPHHLVGSRSATFLIEMDPDPNYDGEVFGFNLTNFLELLINTTSFGAKKIRRQYQYWGRIS